MPALLAVARPQASLEAAVVQWWKPALVVLAGSLGLAIRLTYGRAMPLWFDETFTGVIAGQATVAGLVHWLLTELTGPFYYAPMWLWARVAGVSNEALRLPSLLCTLAAPLFVLRWGHRDATIRLVWAAILLLWLPMAVFANDARPYAQIVLLGTLQAAAFCAVMRMPTRAAALRWVLVTLAMGLTHYMTLWLGLVQGVLLLVLHRRAAVALWPAALPFALLAAWMAFHLPFVAEVASGSMAINTKMGLGDLLRMPALVVGDDRFALLLGLPLGWALVEQLRRRMWRPGPEGWTGLAGVCAFIGFFVVACTVPGMSMRYFIPTLPALLFGVACVVAAAIRRGSIAGPAFLGAMMVASAGLASTSVRDPSIDQRHAFGIDLASRWLGEQPVRRVVFFWADSMAELAPEVDRNLAEIGGFFLRRGSRPVTVDVLHVAADRDAVAAVTAHAGATPGTVVLWVGNALGDNAKRRPGPLFRDPRWSCRDFGAGLAVSIGCRLR